MSSSSLPKSSSKLSLLSNLRNIPSNVGNEKNRNQLELDNSSSSVTSSAFISGLYPLRGESFDDTTDILQGSMVIAEADALLTEYRESFSTSISSSISKIILYPSSSSVSANHLSPNLKSSQSLHNEGRRKKEIMMKKNNNQTGNIKNNHLDNANYSFTTAGSSDSHLSQVEVEVEDGDDSSARHSPRAKQTDSFEELEMIAFLEKYSDRLVEMVAKKVTAKTKGSLS